MEIKLSLQPDCRSMLINYLEYVPHNNKGQLNFVFPIHRLQTGQQCLQFVFIHIICLSIENSTVTKEKQYQINNHSLKIITYFNILSIVHLPDLRQHHRDRTKCVTVTICEC